MKKVITLMLLLMVASAFAQKWLTSPSGVKYKVLKDSPGRTAQVGDIVTVHFQFRNFKDSLINGSTGKDPVEFKLQKTFRGSLEDGLQLMSAGDSMIFEVPSDSLGMPNRPAFIPAGSKVFFRIKMISVQTEAEYQALLKKRAEEMKGKEDLELQKFIKANNYQARKLASGMYIVSQSPGSGSNPKPGQNVEVHYTGKLLNGQKFDSSLDRGTPFSFTLGQGQVIQGWDTGIAELLPGEKAILLIPSYMGYGERGAGASIPPNSILIFEVQLLGVK
ncbi:MAG: FKBP-type peptidyl-prolyl cis-trans isomerase [Cytophagaceae bacterium]|jgi:FKBP-type peptidyl-prolyl cis-trans isomerase|nr:FKBP-type peptidyl-prolyl cis-trans isomerase [Cytophagaceae bacterium]